MAKIDDTNDLLLKGYRFQPVWIFMVFSSSLWISPLLPPPHPRTPTHTHSNIFVPSAADIQWSLVLSVCMCVWEREALDRRLISDSNERFISPSRGHHITHTACSMDVMMISHLGSRREKPSLTFKGIVLIYISVCRRYAWQQIVRVLF